MWNITECLLAHIFTSFLHVACFRFRWHFFPTCSHTRRCPLRGPSSMLSRARSQLRVFVWAKIEKRTNCFGVIVLSINFVHRVTLVKIFNSDLACWLTIICSSMIACSQTFFFYRQFSERETERAREKKMTSIFSFPHPHLFALAVNKSFTVYMFRRALYYLQREKRGSVNRPLYEGQCWPL